MAHTSITTNQVAASTHHGEVSGNNEPDGPENHEEEQYVEGTQIQNDDEAKEDLKLQQTKSALAEDLPLGKEVLFISFVCLAQFMTCLLYTSPSPRDGLLSRMPSSA